jgi:hypothetical protein
MKRGDLVAQRFDPRTGTLSGTPMHVPEPVSRSTRTSRAIFSSSRSGVLAYEADAVSTQLVWMDRQGRRIGALGEPDLFTNPALSSDGRRAAVTRLDPSSGTSDIWVIDEERGARALTQEPGNEDYAVWSADGRSIIFASDRGGPMHMYAKPADAPAARIDVERAVTEAVKATDQNWPVDWSVSGRFVLFQGGGAGIPRRLFAASPSTPKADPLALFSTEPSSMELQEAAQAQISPNERWLAYVADLGRSPQVFIRSFDDRQGPWQISTAGGYEPRWRADGRELFYLSPNRTMMAVALHCQATCDFGTPQPLFRVPSLGAPLRKGSIRNEYAVSRDGNRFLVNEPVDGVAAYSIRIVLNWLSGLRP